MIQFEDIRGSIYGVDDTLLYNGARDQMELGLHARSRLAAAHEIAERFDLPELASLTPTENVVAFRTASTHSIEGGAWNILHMKGLVESYAIDRDDPRYPVAKAIIDRKNELHEVILREFGVEVPGATDFVRNLATHGLIDHQALATAAIKRDVDIFIDKYDLGTLLPDERIISLEKVTKTKPDPECFDLAFKTLGLPDSARRQVLAFEDDPRGLQSAKAAGLFVCAITTRYDRNDPALLACEPDLIADSYQEFNELLGIPSAV